MQRDLVRAVVLGSLCAVLAVGTAHAEEAWKLKVASRDGEGVESTFELLIGTEHLKGREVGGNEEFILGPDGVTTLDLRNKRYMSMSFEQMKQLSQTVQQAGDMEGMMADAMKQALANLPPDQRAEAEKYMKQMKMPGMQPAGPPPDESHYEIEAGSGSETIAGLATKQVVVKKDGKMVAVAWLAKAIDVDAIVANVVRLAEVAPARMRTQQSDLDLYRHLTGFPAKLQDLENGQTFVVVEAEQTTVGADAWTVPGGFEPMTGMPGGG